MSQELAPIENKRPLVMKSKLVHFVSEETAERIQKQLQQQSSHTFMLIRELNITINTAEVEGVYTMDQYADLIKIKQGMYQCEYKQWHTRKDPCDCAKEFFKKQRAERRSREDAAENAPLTEEQRAKNLVKIKELSEHFRKTGIFSGKIIKH